jgi:uncharacterized membrane protein YphA (DoxX/SURF4 family)
MAKKIIFTVLSVLLGLVFIFSGYTKLYPIELFEITFVDIGVASWKIAPFIARILIGLEFFLGILLVLNLWLKKFTLKAVIALLVFFTLFLIGTIITQGNSGNCKCFGNMIEMTPLESIIKNIILIGISLLVYFFHKGYKIPFRKIILVVCLLASFVLPFVLNPVDMLTTEQMQDEAVGYKLDLDLIYNSSDLVKPKVDLRKGKHIIAFMSLTCPHCRVAAYKLHVINKKNPEISMYIFLNGDDFNLKPFFDDTKCENIPHSMLLGQRFVKIAGVKMPSILWVNNSIVEKKLKYMFVNQQDIEEWIKK